MFLLRLFWFFIIGLLARRLFLAWKTPAKTPASQPPPPQPADSKTLTDQDISDADFEEIP